VSPNIAPRMFDIPILVHFVSTIPNLLPSLFGFV
jgi:hypothetical protein